MRITEKLLLVFIPTFMLSVVTMTLFSKRAAQQTLVQDVVRSGLSISLNLAQSRGMVISFETGDERLLLPPLQRIMENTGALYAMVLDPQGSVLAHTNVVEKGRRYDDAITSRALRSDEPVYESLKVDGHAVMDIAFPAWELERNQTDEEYLLLGRQDARTRRRLGTIRLGLPLEESMETAARISGRVFWIVTLVNVVAMGLSLFYVRRVLHPVRLMAAATQRIGRGELGETVSVQSRDEMGDLAHSFNRMSRDLAATTVSKNLLDNILSSMRDILVVTNPDGTVKLLNERILELLDHREEDVVGRSATHLFAPEEELFRPPGLIELAKLGTISRESALISRAGERIPVLVSVAGFRGRGGELEGFIVTATDIAERIEAEERIKESLQEKEMLLKEIHHRVKNNLQIISSLLNLQSLGLEDVRALDILDESQNRVKSMALIHEKLYQSEDITKVDFEEYIQTLAASLFQSYQTSSNIRLSVVVDDVRLGIDQAIPCGLIINELVSNSLKHGFSDGRDGEVSVHFGRTGDRLVALTVKDDGVGLPETVDILTTEPLGLKLVNILVEQLNGEISLAGDPGTEVRIAFDPEATTPAT